MASWSQPLLGLPSKLALSTQGLGRGPGKDDMLCLSCMNKLADVLQHQRILGCMTCDAQWIAFGWKARSSRSTLCWRKVVKANWYWPDVACLDMPAFFHWTTYVYRRLGVLGFLEGDQGLARVTGPVGGAMRSRCEPVEALQRSPAILMTL